MKEPAKENESESAANTNTQEGMEGDAAKGVEPGDTEKLADKETEVRSPEAEPLNLGSPESSLYVDALTPGEHVADETTEEKAGDDEDDKRTIVEELDSAVEKAVANGVLTEEPDHVNGMEEEKEIVDEEDRMKQEKEEKTSVAYVGDATWEEKTWKEIVRLREDMFWARIGGVRE